MPTFDIRDEGLPETEGVVGREDELVSALYLRPGVGAPMPVEPVDDFEPVEAWCINDEGIGGTEGMSGVWLRSELGGRRIDEAGVGVPGPPNDFRAPGVAPTVPMEGRPAVLMGRGVTPAATVDV